MTGAQALTTRLLEHGLHAIGWFNIRSEDTSFDTGFAANAPALLFGSNALMWDIFTDSPEHSDGQDNPMDRFTRRVVTQAVSEIAPSGTAIFPFGTPVYPFQRFAKRAAGLQSSPIGILMHPRFGLWHALRAAVVFSNADQVVSPPHKLNHPCDDCVGKPCLTACPVDAFSSAGFAVKSCRSYLESTSGTKLMASSSSGDSTLPDCNSDGCHARNACPVGTQWRYSQAQLRFHMAAFKK